MCKRDATCGFDKINWLPLTPSNRKRVTLCADHAKIVDAAEPCADVAEVDVAIGMSGGRTKSTARCERPVGHAGPHYHSLQSAFGFDLTR